MENRLTQYSDELAKLAENGSANVVAVHARPHFSSSGVHLRNGAIVTADHTVRRDEDIQVTTADGKTASAVLAGRDRGSDLAVLRVEGLGAPRGNVASGSASGSASGGSIGGTAAAAVRMGDFAMVLGRSRETGANASVGIISAVSGPCRTRRGGRLDQYIRLDATMFPTSSGGAVIDAQGRLIGMATAGLSRIAGLVIPAATVERVTDQLLANGFVPHGYLGVALQPVPIPDALRESLSIPNRRGVMLLHVEAGGPAEQGGALLGDIVLGLGDKTIESAEDVQSFLEETPVGTETQAKILRAGKTVQATIGVRARSRAGA